MNQHRAKATGEHFNLPGHPLSDIRVTVLEKIRNNPILSIENRESKCGFKILQGFKQKINIANCKHFLKNILLGTKTPVLLTKFEPCATL